MRIFSRHEWTNKLEIFFAVFWFTILNMFCMYLSIHFQYCQLFCWGKITLYKAEYCHPIKVLSVSLGTIEVLEPSNGVRTCLEHFFVWMVLDFFRKKNKKKTKTKKTKKTTQWFNLNQTVVVVVSHPLSNRLV